MAQVEPLGNPSSDPASDHRLRRPEPRHQAQKRHGLHPRFAQIAQGQRAQALRQRLPLRAGQQGMVREGRRRAAQRLDDLDLRRGVGHVVGPAHDMGDPHVHVVHDRRDGIEHLPIRADQHRVRDAARIDRQIAEDAVRPLDPLPIQLETPDARTALCAQPRAPPPTGSARRGHRPAADPCSVASCASGPARWASRTPRRTGPSRATHPPRRHSGPAGPTAAPAGPT
jgi:hypothetical protein